MSPDEAADLAARIFAAIQRNDAPTGSQSVADYCRERVASDFTGLLQHAGLWAGKGDCLTCWQTEGCPDATRYAAGLLRTAALYGVTP